MAIIECPECAKQISDQAPEASIDDQLRECRRHVERQGFEIVAEYGDKALSGGTARRPEYQRMVRDARDGRSDVIVAEDCSRLWRNVAEQAPRLGELMDLGVHVVTTRDLDTRQESTAGIMGAVNGAMLEHYRREIAYCTRRGLEGLARQKKATGTAQKAPRWAHSGD